MAGVREEYQEGAARQNLGDKSCGRECVRIVACEMQNAHSSDIATNRHE